MHDITVLDLRLMKGMSALQVPICTAVSMRRASSLALGGGKNFYALLDRFVELMNKGDLIQDIAVQADHGAIYVRLTKYNWLKESPWSSMKRAFTVV